MMQHEVGSADFGPSWPEVAGFIRKQEFEINNNAIDSQRWNVYKQFFCKTT